MQSYKVHILYIKMYELYKCIVHCKVHKNITL